MICGQCKVCGHWFALNSPAGCPVCRLERVQQAFKPIDSLRTALAIERLHDAAQFTKEHPQIEEDTERTFSVVQRLRELDKVEMTPWHWHGEAPREEPEADEGKYRIPRGEQAQLYELRRMRKLIGKL